MSSSREPASPPPSTAAQPEADKPLSRWTPPISDPKFTRFAEWTQKAGEQRGSLPFEQEGIALARERRAALAELVQHDPETALKAAIPYPFRKALPESVQALLEEPVSARGDIDVYGVLPEEGHETETPPLFRKAVVGDQIYDAFVYGRRLGEPTLRNVPFHGIAVGSYLALHEEPARVLDPEEAADLKISGAFVDPVCSVSGNRATPEEGVLVQVGSEIGVLCHPDHIDDLNKKLLAASGSGTVSASSVSAAAITTTGTKKLLVLRVDFSDLAGEPFSEATATNIVTGLNTFYREMSYGKAGFYLMGEGSSVTPLLRLPQTANYYGTNNLNDKLRSDALAAARAAGFDSTKYDLDLTCFGAVPGLKYAGLGFVGARGAWIRASSSVGVPAHELGHNFGLNHANFWDTSSQSVIGTGESVEYGDKFDTMGSANAGSKHFNARYKSYLNWLTSTEVQTITQSGTYRLFPHDDPNATGIRALRTAKNSTTNYWMEFRQHYSGNKWLADGIGLRWGLPGNEKTMLLDVTPGTPAGKDDSALLIGRTFSDRAAGVHITPIGKGGTTPESIDVVVNRGSFPGNLPPILTLNASASNIAANAEVQFTAIAVDPNLDALAYFWDFGDGTWGSNSASAAHIWTVIGEYVVRCTVSDMKGGVASSSLVIRIGSPSTYRLAGRVFSAEGLPIEGVRISTSSGLLTWSDSDGSFVLAGLSAASYSLEATLEGYVFDHPAFQNPVSVGPSRSSLNFLGSPPNGRTVLTLVPSGAVWQYLDNGSNQGAAWRAPEFDDAAWSEGAAPLGYGDDNEKTPLNYGPNASSKYVTTYFRHPFIIEDASLLSAVTLNLRRDDGAVVYLNGKEILRSNMPATTAITYTTLASANISGSAETTFYASDIAVTNFLTGTNLLAVEIHQSSRSSADIGFDLELTAVSLPVTRPPNLSIRFTGAGLEVFWPDSATAWQLYAASNLFEGPWFPVPWSPTPDNAFRTVALPPSETQQFFRLRAP